MRKIWQVIAVAVVGLGLGLAVVGCGSSTPGGKEGAISRNFALMPLITSSAFMP